MYEHTCYDTQAIWNLMQTYSNRWLLLSSVLGRSGVQRLASMQAFVMHIAQHSDKTISTLLGYWSTLLQQNVVISTDTCKQHQYTPENIPNGWHIVSSKPFRQANMTVAAILFQQVLCRGASRRWHETSEPCRSGIMQCYKMMMQKWSTAKTDLRCNYTIATVNRQCWVQTPETSFNKTQSLTNKGFQLALPPKVKHPILCLLSHLCMTADLRQLHQV